MQTPICICVLQYNVLLLDLLKISDTESPLEAEDDIHYVALAKKYWKLCVSAKYISHSKKYLAAILFGRNNKTDIFAKEWILFRRNGR
jgi:hypothetical protein